MKPNHPRICLIIGGGGAIKWWQCYGDGVTGFGVTPAASYQSWRVSRNVAEEMVNRQAGV